MNEKDIEKLTETFVKSNVIVPDERLGKLVREYTHKQDAMTEAWLKIVEYVRDNEPYRKILVATLLEYGEFKPPSANREASIIHQVIRSGLLKDALEGKIKPREIRGKLRIPKKEAEREWSPQQEK